LIPREVVEHALVLHLLEHRDVRRERVEHRPDGAEVSLVSGGRVDLLGAVRVVVEEIVRVEIGDAQPGGARGRVGRSEVDSRVRRWQIARLAREVEPRIVPGAADQRDQRDRDRYADRGGVDGRGGLARRNTLADEVSSTVRGHVTEHDVNVADAGEASRAIEAVERAAVIAETGEADRPILVASPADFRAAASRMLPDLRARLDRVMMGSDPETGLDALLASGALDVMLPEVRALVGFGDGEWRHKDVWKHTKQVVRQAVPRIEVRWAALLHDVGKVRTRSISPSGEVHFFGHAEVGARMFDKLDRRLPLFSPEPALRSSVRFLILHHLRANQYESSWTDSAVRRFAREMGEHLEDLLCLSRADITTKRPEKKRRGLSQIGDLADRIRALAAADAVVPPLPGGVGDAIMKAFGLGPSRQVGEIKRALEAAVLAGEVPANLESEAYVQFLAENAARFGLAR
jgi:poly(A) polymerase